MGRNEVVVGEKVGFVGEQRVDAAVAKKAVVDVVEGAVDAEAGLTVPEVMIWRFVGQMKMGRPIVSFARASISCQSYVDCLQMSLV